jgi:hypothetical protein
MDPRSGLEHARRRALPIRKVVGPRRAVLAVAIAAVAVGATGCSLLGVPPINQPPAPTPQPVPVPTTTTTLAP